VTREKLQALTDAILIGLVEYEDAVRWVRFSQKDTKAVEAVKALQEHPTIKRAAAAVGCSPSTFYRRLATAR